MHRYTCQDHYPPCRPCQVLKTRLSTHCRNSALLCIHSVLRRSTPPQLNNCTYFPGMWHSPFLRWWASGCLCLEWLSFLRSQRPSRGSRYTGFGGNSSWEWRCQPGALMAPETYAIKLQVSLPSSYGLLWPSKALRWWRVLLRNLDSPWTIWISRCREGLRKGSTLSVVHPFRCDLHKQ